MSQNYSDPKRANDPHALPDVETFRTRYGYCKHCGSLNLAIPGHESAKWRHCEECKRVALIDHRGWFWHSCFPGCLPDSEPFGPFDTEADALADAQANADDDDTPDDDADDDDSPDEDSITTSDHLTFYQYGKLVLRSYPDDRRWYCLAHNGGMTLLGEYNDCESALRAYMDRVQFWPNVFVISDHGNAHRIDLSEEK